MPDILKITVEKGTPPLLKERPPKEPNFQHRCILNGIYILRPAWGTLPLIYRH